ncbi:UNVERIFIED_CONTAM: hypothetical protein GTU68_022462, partial [Idotea baltica]|nr:hypothetical protein [Idotea baltica]
FKKKRRGGRRAKHLHLQGVEASTSRTLGVSSKAMSFMNSFVNDIFEKNRRRVFSSCSYNKRSTSHHREIQLGCQASPSRVNSPSTPVL